MSFKKSIGFAGLLATGLATAASATPAFALSFGGGSSGKGASGGAWSASQMMSDAYGNVGTGSVTDFTAADFASWIGTFTTWALGLAIAAFVLKVVLTAIDRMIFGNKAAATGSGGVLKAIPLIGAYDESLAWKDIWIHFGKQVGIVAGAWVVVQLIVNIVLFAFGAVTPGAA